jgi:hypothetical protein
MSNHLKESESGSSGTDTALPPQTVQQVTTLARTITEHSLQQVQLQQVLDATPSIEMLDLDPELNPRSDKFDLEKYVRFIVSIDSQGIYTTAAGISFTGLNVFGYGTSTDHQKTVGNVLLDLPAMVRNMIGRRGKRIDILSNFEGLVGEGEMLLVLGPPGRYGLASIDILFLETNSQISSQWLLNASQDDCWRNTRFPCRREFPDQLSRCIVFFFHLLTVHTRTLLLLRYSMGHYAS